MREDVVIVEAVRTPFGRRNGGLSSMHSIDLLALVLNDLVRRSGVDPSEVGQVVGGCVGQVGMQTMNVTRQAWLAAGLPLTVPASTIDAQCGSSQQALTLAYGLVRGGVVDAAVACGVEVMSRVPMGAAIPRDGAYGKPVTRQYWGHHEFTSQFEAAERIADQWGITRDDCDHFGKESQDRAASARHSGAFDSQLVAVEAPDIDEAGKPTGSSHLVTADEGIRPTTLEGLGGLRTTGRPDGVHTAGTSSQISDGASAVLLMTASAARHAGLTPIATIVESCLIGSDPVLMLTGPIAATQTLLTRSGLTMHDIDVVEINEAFAAVVLAWERELKPDMSRVNPNGGAIALGHPLGATGTGLMTKAVHELVRADHEHAIVTMCCGGGLGTGTLLRRAG
jgi:acetyl-CoA C-acetyltransferase